MTEQPPTATQRRADCERIALEAAKLLHGRFGDPGIVRGKGDTAAYFDLVTEVDVLSEQLVLGLIREVAPHSVVLAEEGGVTSLDGSPVESDPADVDELWIVDPLDGTINFAYGIPHFAVSIACWRRGEPVAGAIADPMVGEIFSFERTSDDDRAAFHNGERLEPLAAGSAGESLVYVGSSASRMPELLREFRGCRQLASAALALAWVTVGRCGAYVQLGKLNPWDWAAGVPMIRALGGVVTDDDGSAWRWELRGSTGIIAGPSGVHADVVRVLFDGEDCA
jgi:myo-inositol-1(or 4)-monophosphatase